MPPVKPPPAPTNRIQASLAQDVGRDGWTALAVLPTEEHPGVPFVYTLGLWRSYDHPELIITSFGGLHGHAVLGELVAQIQEGEKFIAGLHEDLFPGPMRNYDGWLRPVEDGNRDKYMQAAKRWNAYEDFPALQVIWPDPLNHFPWESAYDRKFAQTLLDKEGAIL